MKLVNMVQEFIMEEDRDFDSGHASTLLELKDGGVLVSWFGGSWEKGPDVAIWVSKRAAYGTSDPQNGLWERPRKVHDVRGVAMWNPVLFRKNDGTIVLYYKVGATIQQWQTYYMESTDEGESFSEPRELVPGDIGGRGPVKNKPILLHDNTIVAPASLEGETWDAFVDISTDDGKTWEMSDLVPMRRAGFNIQMVDRPYDKHLCFGKGVIQPTLWEDKDNVLHMFLRSTSSRIFRSDSTDGGRTWCVAYDTGHPNNNSGLDLVKLPNGTLVMAYNPRENLPGYYKGPRTPLVVAYSKDNGETFHELAVLENGQGGFAYPSIICNDKHEIFVSYTWKRERIVCCKLTYED